MYRGAATAAVAVASIMATLVAVILTVANAQPSFPIASVGQTSMARCAAAVSSGVSGCLEKCTAVSSRLYVKRFGASSRQRTAQRAAGVHVPRPRHVLGLSTQVIRHIFNKRMVNGEENHFEFGAAC